MRCGNIPAKTLNESIDIYLVQLRAFFISKIFIGNAKLKFAKNQANVKQHLEVKLLLFENYPHFSYTLSSKNNGTYSKK